MLFERLSPWSQLPASCEAFATRYADVGRLPRQGAIRIQGFEAGRTVPYALGAARVSAPAFVMNDAAISILEEPMVKRILLAVGAGVLLAAIAPVAQSQAAGAGPISISQCFVTVPKAMSKKASGTQIDYTNLGPKTAKHITFAVKYRNSETTYLRKVIDDGTFTPNAPVVHHFSLYNDVTYGGKAATCSAVLVIWADGTKWVAGAM
jgi:hypothetical protein